MKKYINETINDYTIIDSEVLKDSTYVTAKCDVCGHIRKMRNAEFRRVKNIHSFKTCGIDYLSTNPLIGDYKFIGITNLKNTKK